MTPRPGPPRGGPDVGVAADARWRRPPLPSPSPASSPTNTSTNR